MRVIPYSTRKRNSWQNQFHSFFSPLFAKPERERSGWQNVSLRLVEWAIKASNIEEAKGGGFLLFVKNEPVFLGES